MKDLFKYFYVIFLVSAILYGSTYIGFLSIRQLSTLIMLVLLIRERVVFKVDKVIKCYFGFLIFFFFSSINEGVVGTFLKDLVANYFVALVGYQATIVLITKYNAEVYLINTMVGIGVFSSVLTVLQYNGFGIVANIILDSLMIPLTELEFLERMLESGDIMSNIALSGAFVSPVPNGYYLSLAGVLALYPVIKADNFINKVFSLVIWALIFYGSFCCQQRLSFVMLIIISAFVFLILKGHFRYLIYILFFIGVNWVVSNFDSIDLGRFASFEDENRKSIYSMGMAYLSDNILFGGISGFREKTGGISPHNLFINALAYSGIFGALFIFYIVIVQLKRCFNFKVLLKPSVLNIVIMGYLAITANSLTHNSSIVTGDIYFWVMWGAIVALYKRIGGIKGVG